jgi:hypothetical protein
MSSSKSIGGYFMSRKRAAIQEQAPQLPDEMWDIERVMAFLKVSRSRVFQLMRKEGLPCVKWDRVLRFNPLAIAKWLREQEQRSA